MSVKILLSVTHVNANVKASMILPVILQEGAITNTNWKQPHCALLGFAFLCFVVLFIGFREGSIPNKVSANIKYIHYSYRQQI